LRQIPARKSRLAGTIRSGDYYAAWLTFSLSHGECSGIEPFL
jgi:hypothetical protein